MFLCLAAAFSSAQPVSITVGQTGYPVEFVDKSLPYTNKQVIVADLTIILSYATSFDALKGDPVTDQTGEFMLRTPATPRLPFNGQPEIIVWQTAEGAGIRIGKTVSDIYIKAISIRDANIEAFQKADNFLALLNDPGLLNKPVSVLRDLYHTQPISPAVSLPESAVVAFATDIQNFTFPGISLLDFENVHIPGASADPLLSFSLLFVPKTNPAECMRFHVVYYENRWGLGWVPF